MIRRKLTLSAWQSALANRDFDRVAAATAIKALPAADAIMQHDGAMTSVVVRDVGSDMKPTVLQVLALHDEANRPNAWEFGQPARTITLPSGTYTAFITHVVLWPGYVTGHDMWANAPGLGRLALFISRRTDERVVFRPLFDPSLRERLDDLRCWRGSPMPYLTCSQCGLRRFSAASWAGCDECPDCDAELPRRRTSHGGRPTTAPAVRQPVATVERSESVASGQRALCGDPASGWLWLAIRPGSAGLGWDRRSKGLRGFKQG